MTPRTAWLARRTGTFWPSRYARQPLFQRSVRTTSPAVFIRASILTLVGISCRISASPRHSGGLERHYAPRTPARLVPVHELDREIARLKDKVAVLAFSRPDERVDYWLRMPRNPQAYARKLYAALRELDSASCEAILIEAPPSAPEWAAVLDRLRRACG